MDVVKILENCAKTYAHKSAIIFCQEQLSFPQLRDKVFALGQGLLKLGVSPGDKVAIYLPNWPEYVLSYLAIWSIGACSVPLDFMFTEDEILSCLSHCEAKILITKHKANLSFAALKARLPLLENIISCQSKDEQALSFEELIAAELTLPPKLSVQEDDCAIIFYTSGTTGKPKGVLISYAQLDAPPKSMAFFV
ncbi:MAG: class I adenylate-forming enzyme family protein, partial [Candidatus Omnitrophota bacterium]